MYLNKIKINKIKYGPNFLQKVKMRYLSIRLFETNSITDEANCDNISSATSFVSSRIGTKIVNLDLRILTKSLVVLCLYVVKCETKLGMHRIIGTM